MTASKIAQLLSRWGFVLLPLPFKAVAAMSRMTGPNRQLIGSLLTLAALTIALIAWAR